MAEPTVRVSGTVLASLMFQHLNSDSDVEGLVLGEGRIEEQVTISDSQADHIHIEETYNVQKHIACHRLNTLYSNTGDVNMEAVQKMLVENKQESVIGWYRQRRNTEQQMTLREKLIHENLKNVLSNPHMIFLLLTSSKVTPSGSTHRIEYSAFISRSRSRFFSSDGLLKEVKEVNSMNESLQVELQKSCRDVEESERLVEALQAEVCSLRRRLKEKQQKEAAEEPEPVHPSHQRNVLLQDSVSSLSCCPLFCSQTLNLQGFPLPDVSTVTQVNADSPPADRNRKRPREEPMGGDRKRRRS
ncbi:BRCA1-A complex subunit Abraxas 1 isoform X2 [Acanthochromis polyacanthus]|uniref:BRCA1-A complex subunit Abraxas 1 isoform X2 n=1 Tax=Acanthochromis polyacanthus TaxID=80966 RepID=UPI002233F6F1|nr:BRCA1-A complex subunit Abraxas 1 isoform X2 [Acanthochromis polyacanthus]